MLDHVKRILFSLIEAGIKPGLSRSFSKKIRMSNLICVVLCLITLPYAFIFTALGAPGLGALVIPIALAYLSFIGLNAKGYYSSSRFSVITLFNSAVTVYSYGFGFKSGIHLLFFPLACFSLILFEFKERFYLAWSALLPISLFLLFIYLDPQPFIQLPEATREGIRFLLIPTSFIILLASVFYLQLANDRAEDKLGKALATLQQETDRSHQIFDAIKDMIVLKGPDARLIWGNKAFREFHELSIERVQELAEDPQMQADRNLQSVKDDFEVLKSGEFMQIEEEPLIRCDGTTCWFSTIKTPIKDSQGKASMLVAVCRDITQQKELNQIIAEQKSKMITSSRLSALGEMAAGIAHEINNPLTIMLGRSSNLRRVIENQPDKLELIKEFSLNIDSMAHRIAKIIRGLRSFARDGEQDPFVTASLRDIFEETMNLCATRIQAQGIKVEVSTIPEDFTLECRPVQISQVLLNMVANASDAVEGSEDQWIKLNVTRTEDGYQIEVTDSGPGVAADAREKIFQPFFTTKPVGKGTGLGLSVTKGIVEEHQGQIRLDETAPFTRFLINLPRSRVPSKQKSA